MTAAADGSGLAELIATIEEQQRRLVLRHFDNHDAWRLGCLFVEVAEDRKLPEPHDRQHPPDLVDLTKELEDEQRAEEGERERKRERRPTSFHLRELRKAHHAQKTADVLE